MRRRSSSTPDQDIGELGSKLQALCFPNRLRLVRDLEEPAAVDEIRLTPGREGPQGSPDRNLTREGVRHHLKQLEEADLVRSVTRPDDRGRNRRLYVVNEPSVFGLLEDLRGMLATGGEERPGPFETEGVRRAKTGQTAWGEGPKLVLIQGPDEERVFNLRRVRSDRSRGRRWIIGRSRDAEIPLTYDPYLSAKNTEILEDGGEFRIVDFRVSTNGTRVNDESLEPGEERTLEHGDVVTVGCSALVFHER